MRRLRGIVIATAAFAGSGRAVAPNAPRLVPTRAGARVAAASPRVEAAVAVRTNVRDSLARRPAAVSEPFQVRPRIATAFEQPADDEPPVDDPGLDAPLASLAASPLAAAHSARRSHGHALVFDVGVPDGATLALATRPLPTVELTAGASYNGISPGLRAGVAWIPLAGRVSPTLSIDVGHYFTGNANPLARLVSGDPMFNSPLLDRIGYDYADADVGVQVRVAGATLFVRAGASRIVGTLHGLDALGAGGKMPVPVSGADPTVTLTMLSARVGMVVHFGS